VISQLHGGTYCNLNRCSDNLSRAFELQVFLEEAWPSHDFSTSVLRVAHVYISLHMMMMSMSRKIAM
jgi:hypothetical protein